MPASRVLNNSIKNQTNWIDEMKRKIEHLMLEDIIQNSINNLRFLLDSDDRLSETISKLDSACKSNREFIDALKKSRADILISVIALVDETEKLFKVYESISC